MSGRVELCADTRAVRPEWDALADLVGASPFVRAGWIDAWWRAFGRGTPELATVRRDGRLVAVLPLRRVAGVVASPTNWHTPVFGCVAADEAAATALVDWLLERRYRHVALSFLDSDDALCRAFVGAAPAAGYRVAIRPRLRSPYLTLTDGFAGVDTLLTGKRRRDLRRRRRLLEHEGRLSFDVLDGREDLALRLAEGFAIEALGWKGERGTAIAAHAQTRRFYTEAAAWAASHGWLRLCFLRVDGRAVAFDLALEQGGRHYLVKTGYDPEYARFAPGVLLRQEAIGRAAALGLSSYEFLGQAEPTKLEWTQTCHTRVLAQAFRRTPTGTLDWAVFTHGRSVAGRIRARVRA